MGEPTTSRVISVLHFIAAVALASWLIIVIMWPLYSIDPANKGVLASFEKLCQRYFCHRQPNRSLAWGGGQLLVCSRCTGVIAGYMLGAVTALCGAERLRLWRIPWALVMIALMGVSWLGGQFGYLQASWHAERVVAGAFGGLGGYILIARCVVLLIQWLQRRNKRKLEEATL